MPGKGKDLDDITTVHHARKQETHADYVLAQEEFERKKKTLAGVPGVAVHKNTASSLAARRDHEDQVRQLKKRLADPALPAHERAALERELKVLQGA